MPQGQQRRNNARGRISSQDLPRLDMQWSVFTTSLTEIVIEVPAGIVPQPTGHVLQAIIVETGAVPISTVVTDQFINCTYAAVPPTPCTVRVPSNDPAIRNSSGGYLIGLSAEVNPIGPRPAFREILVSEDILAVNTLVYGGSTVTLTIPTATDVALQWTVGVESTGAQVTVEEQGGYTVGVLTAGQLKKVAHNGANWAFYNYPGL